MKPFLIIQLRLEDKASDSEFEAILRTTKLSPGEVTRIRAEKNGLPRVDFDACSGIIVGGSPFDITTPENERPAIQKQLLIEFAELFDYVVAEDFPFIGACSGCGLLGNYCKTTISRRYSEPVGGVDITLTEAGMKDPLLEGLPVTFRALVGHKEACDTAPVGAELLASSTSCPVQMFRMGQNVYATQFHPEADRAEFELRIQVYKNYGYFKPEEADTLLDNLSKEEIIYPRIILERFAALYKG